MAEVKDHGDKGQTVKLSKADLDKAKSETDAHHKRFTLRVKDK